MFCPWQAFPAKSNVCGQVQELTLDLSSLKGASLGAVALPANIRLGRKGLPGKNTLAYYEHSYIMAVKSFIKLG